MADGATIYGASVSTIALIIALVCLGWIIIREIKEHKLFGIDKVFANHPKLDVFQGGY